MELRRMTKKRVWVAGCIVVMLILTCTVLSIRIEKLMRIEVEVADMTQTEEEKKNQLVEIPLSCYPTENLSFFYYIKEREGLFGKELVAVSEESSPVYTEGDRAVLVDTRVMDKEGRPLQIIAKSTYPLEENDLVVLAEEKKVDMNKQIKILIGIGIWFLIGIFLVWWSIRKMVRIWNGERKEAVKGVLAVFIWLVVLFWLTGLVDIPREYLPPEQILDVKFYLETWKEF